MLLSAASAGIILFVGFMMKALFFGEWPWWAWEILALVALTTAIWANWMGANA